MVEPAFAYRSTQQDSSVSANGHRSVQQREEGRERGVVMCMVITLPGSAQLVDSTDSISSSETLDVLIIRDYQIKIYDAHRKGKVVDKTYGT